MKFLDTPELTRLQDILSFSGPECKVHTRFEAYSCKSISKERKLFNQLEKTYAEQEESELYSMSPEMREANLESCFGRLDQKDSRQTWFNLIATLNIAFPDYDFTSVRPDHFSKEGSVVEFLKMLSETVLELRGDSKSSSGEIAPRSYGSYPASSSLPLPPHSTSYHSPTLSTSTSTPSSVTHPHLHRILSNVIDLENCEVYSYSPDGESDPHADSSSEDEPWGGEDEFDDLGDGLDFDEDFTAGSGSHHHSDFGSVGGFKMTGINTEGLGGGRQRRKRRKSSNSKRKGAFEFDFLEGDSDSDSDEFSPSSLSTKKKGEDSGYFSSPHLMPSDSTLNNDTHRDDEDGGFAAPTLSALPLVPIPVKKRNHPFQLTTGTENSPTLWSVNYFLVSKKMKRVLFISVWARKRKFGGVGSFGGAGGGSNWRI